ncbi:18846_t:CDS:2, partial [Racocetra persica]
RLHYIADLYSMTALLLNNNWASTVKPPISFEITKWIFVVSILMSFILLFLEIKKAYKIEIQDRENWKDKVAFYVFFAFKGYKRLLLCDGPRQVINGLTVFTILRDKKFSMNISVIGQLLAKNRRDRIADATNNVQSKDQQPTLPALRDDYALPQYSGPPPKAFNLSDAPPDQLKYN